MKALIGSKNGFPPWCGIPSTLMQQARLRIDGCDRTPYNCQ
ncbi:hypothetical protein MC7420_7770 [Coleofasciculus chthonoplastes PCC 7420]|uniref:Uncharacterized protein n=1 Tax=Coleofasciculus chthonoplastes PCC 7420 TaxID=118168 RepID=B4VIL7_9CYAN|nr:hypothetical protein [Coleofasciculus chthonoplastes]EDX78032.1 hypothetical protein MC7420_7770 [Coleofasciculus chthonoplastes PCC 7420]